MEGVSSSLIARNESWVRKQAASLARRLPSNVEKADLIQAGLIAVAQSALAFEWEGDRESEEARLAFVRYAQQRVKGAMIDELRQLDHLSRPQRRKIKVIEIARERWHAERGSGPGLSELSEVCGLPVNEIAELDQAARMASVQSLDGNELDDEPSRVAQPATAADEVEARVDTAILMRRLAKYFETLPEQDRLVIDSYLGIGLAPSELASRFNVTPSRVSQMFTAACRRIAVKFGNAEPRAADRVGPTHGPALEEAIQRREQELSPTPQHRGWNELMENVLLGLRNGQVKPVSAPPPPRSSRGRSPS